MKILGVIFLFISLTASSQRSTFLMLNQTNIDTIQFNLYDSTRAAGKMANNNPGGNNIWNQWSINMATSGGEAASSAYFLYRNGSQSPYRAVYDDQAGSVDGDYSDNTAGYGAASVANSTNFPDSTFWVAGFKQSATPSTLTFSGLDNSYTYRLEILSSRNSGTSRPQTFSYGSASVSLDASLNKSTVIVLNNLVPSAGTIVVNIAYTATFCYVNAARLIRIKL